MAAKLTVTPRYVLVPKILIAPNPDKLVQFQVVEYISPWALKKNLREPSRTPLYDLVVYNKQEYFRFPRFCLPAILLHFPAAWDICYFTLNTVHHSFTAPILPLSTFEPTTAQAQIAEHLMTNVFTPRNLSEGGASATVVLDTGLGKTLLALHVFHRLQLHLGGPPSSLLYITPNNTLAAQAADELRSYLSPTAIVAITPTQYANICVLNIDKLLTLADKTFFNCFNMVVYDEVPNYCTDTRKHIFFISKTTVSLGLTAEPYSRSDHLDPIFHAHLGPVIDEEHYDHTLVNIPITFITHQHRAPDAFIPPHKNSNLGSTDFLGSCRKCLNDDDSYTEAILKLSGSLHKRKMPHYIFTHHVDYANKIYNAIRTLAPHVPIGLLADNSKTVGLNATLQAAKIIIADYSMGTFGISIVQMVAAIWTSPPYQTRYKQVAGRIKRFNKADLPHNNIVREVHMVRDKRHWWLNRHYELIEAYFKTRPNDTTDLPS